MVLWIHLLRALVTGSVGDRPIRCDYPRLRLGLIRSAFASDADQRRASCSVQRRPLRDLLVGKPLPELALAIGRYQVELLNRARQRRLWRRSQREARHALAAAGLRYPFARNVYAMTTKVHSDVAVGAAGNAAVVNAPLGQLDAALSNLVYDVKAQFAAVGNGVADDTTPIANMVTAIKAAPYPGGIGYFPPGDYRYTSINLDATNGIIFAGQTSVTSGTGLPSRLVCTLGAAAGNAIKATSAYGAVFRNLYLTNSNAAFNGFLVDYQHGTGATDSSFGLIDNCVFFLGTAAFGVNFDRAIDCTIRECNFSGGGAIRGGALYANAIQITSTRFVNAAVTPILSTTSQAWTIAGCTFEALSTNAPGAINLTGANATSITGCWFGDAGATAGTWINWSGNALTVSGNYISGNVTGSTGITIQGSSNFGINITGNAFASLLLGVALGAANGPATVLDNSFASVTTPVSGTPVSGLVQTGAAQGTATLNYMAFRARAYLNAAQSIPNATLTKIAFDTKTGTGGYDPNGNFDVVTNRRYVAQTTGYHRVTARAEFASSVAGFFGPLIYINGAANNASRGLMATAIAGQSDDIILLTVGDYVEAFIQQSSGGAVNLAGGLAGGTFMAIHYLSS